MRNEIEKKEFKLIFFFYLGLGRVLNQIKFKQNFNYLLFEFFNLDVP